MMAIAPTYDGIWARTSYEHRAFAYDGTLLGPVMSIGPGPIMNSPYNIFSPLDLSIPFKNLTPILNNFLNRIIIYL